MGKNQAYKAMQRAKMASQPGAPGTEDVEDGMMDGSFHSPEWHAARLASLQTSHTITWEEYKRRQKDEAKRREEEEDGEVRLMREYRAQLDAERAHKLARGINHSDKKVSRKGKEVKRKDKKKKESKKKRKHRSDSESELEDDVAKYKSRRKSRDKSRRDKDQDRKSCRKASRSSSGSSSDEEYGPVPLSSFFEGKS